MKLKKLQIVLLLLIGFVLGSGATSYYPTLNWKRYSLEKGRVTSSQVLPQPTQVDMSTFWQVWKLIKSDFLFQNKVQPEKMIQGAIRGMVASLGDPYTAYLPPQENKESKDNLKGQFEGVGIQLGYRDNKLSVVSPLPNTPAYRAGMKAGDIIAAIDKQDSLHMSLPEAVKEIRGPRGTPVVLTVIRRGVSQPLDIKIVRDTITVPTVELKILQTQDGGFAHLSLYKFGDLTDGQWRQAVDRIITYQRLHPQRFRGVILDLRNNPGGYLNGAIYIASEFIDKGTVVMEENRDGSRQLSKVNRQGRLINQPLVVLVNKGSASASEIVTGALRDHRRAIIVGQTTFGKGTIQEVKDLTGGAGLHITIAKWLTPKSDWVHNQGIKPQIEISEDELKGKSYDQVEKIYLEKAEKVLLNYSHYLKQFYEGNN